MLYFSIYCADGVVLDVAESDDATVSNLLGRFGSVQRARIVPGTDGRRGCTFTQLRTLNRHQRLANLLAELQKPGNERVVLLSEVCNPALGFHYGNITLRIMMLVLARIFLPFGLLDYILRVVSLRSSRRSRPRATTDVNWSLVAVAPSNAEEGTSCLTESVTVGEQTSLLAEAQKVKYLQTVSADMEAMTLSELGAEVFADLQEQHGLYARLLSTLVDNISVLIKLVIAVANMQHDLHLTTIAKEAMLDLLWEPGQVPGEGQRVSELELDPLCGLALATNCSVNAYNPTVDERAARAKRSLPAFRRDAAGTRRTPGSVEGCRFRERMALSSLLQPIRLLVAFPEAACGSAAKRKGSVERMACKLRALMPAVGIADCEHGWVLKGLVVESATSARLVLLVCNPLGEWECWATPATETAGAFISCIALAVLRDGPTLKRLLLERDFARHGTVAAEYKLQERELAAEEEHIRRSIRSVDSIHDDWVPPRLIVQDVNHALCGPLTDRDYERD